MFATVPMSASSPAAASAYAMNMAAMNMASNMFECDQTGCALISHHTGGGRPLLTPNRKD